MDAAAAAAASTDDDDDNDKYDDDFDCIFNVCVRDIHMASSSDNKRQKDDV